LLLPPRAAAYLRAAVDRLAGGLIRAEEASAREALENERAVRFLLIRAELAGGAAAGIAQAALISASPSSAAATLLLLLPFTDPVHAVRGRTATCSAAADLIEVVAASIVALASAAGETLGADMITVITATALG
jgi:hypothetical protein